jgi:hypothetical protein
MPVPTSGAISLANLQTELEGVTAGANGASLSEFYAGGSYVTAGSVAFPGGVRTAIPTSGEISLDDFYGAKWFGADQGYAYATPGTYTVTIANRTGFINNYRYSGIIQAGGGGGGGAHGSTAPNTDVINSGGGGGGGQRINFNGTATGSTLTFTIVVGAGGGGGGNSTAANPYTPGGTPGGAGGNSQLYINGALIANAAGGGGGGAGALNNGSLGTSGAAGTHYGTGNSPGAGYGSNDYRAAGGRGGDTIFGQGALGYYPSGSSTISGGRGAGGAGGGGEGGDLRNTASAGGAGYARIFFKSDFPNTTSASWSSAGSYSWTVPAGIYYVQANITGAGGGGSYSAAGGWNVVFINVTPGEVLGITVGGPGGVSGWGDATLTVGGGYAGGGGGDKYQAANAVAGGGGYSGIFRGSTPLAIAGGGGGYASQDATGSGAGGEGSSNIFYAAPGGSPDHQPMWSGYGASPVTSNSGSYLAGTTGSTGKGACGGGGGGYAGGGAHVDPGGTPLGSYFAGGGGSSYKDPSVGEYYRLPGECTGGSWASPYGNTGTQGQVVIYY